VPDVSDPYASLPHDDDEPDHGVLDVPDDFYGDVHVEYHPYAARRDRPLRLRPFGALDEVVGMRTLN
jgi:hypothetical protein